MQSKITEIINNWISTIDLLPEGNCMYFPFKNSRVKAFMVSASEPLSLEIIDELLNQGFRRSGNLFYQNHCSLCKLCISIRIRPKIFNLSKSQKRLMKKNRHLKVKIIRPNASSRKKNIYLRYLYKKHFLSPSPGITREKEFDMKASLAIMQEQMYKNIDYSLEMELYQKENLAGFSIIDMGSECASLVYLVFDPKYEKLSPGKYLILKAIEWAKTNGYKYIHLGFYIPGHPKMDYKASFKPSEILSPMTGKWEELITNHPNVPDAKKIIPTNF